MKVAYLIDRESIGGGCEYIRRKSDERRMMKDECRTFYSSAGECSSAVLDAWGADEIVVNHLRALAQLLVNPLCRPKGCVTFVIHGIHLRKYDWLIRENPRGMLLGLPILSLKRFARRTLERWLYHRCDRIVALTQTDRNDILRLYGQDLPVDVESNTLDGWIPELADALPSGVSGTFAYVCIGRFDYQKGQDRLIRWLAGSGSSLRRADAAVLFVGGGDTLEPCKTLAQALGVADRCVFVGAIPDADRYLKCADVVVSPSRWEGMPYLMMKARALGCRILATDCPGNRDVLAGYEKWEKLEL